MGSDAEILHIHTGMHCSAPTMAENRPTALPCAISVSVTIDADVEQTMVDELNGRNDTITGYMPRDLSRSELSSSSGAAGAAAFWLARLA